MTIGTSLGAALITLAALYFVIKWAVKNAIEESRSEISKAVKKGIEEYYEKTNLSSGVISYVDVIRNIVCSICSAYFNFSLYIPA